jgi:hypothetical protein
VTEKIRWVGKKRDHHNGQIIHESPVNKFLDDELVPLMDAIKITDGDTALRKGQDGEIFKRNNVWQ